MSLLIPAITELNYVEVADKIFTELAGTPLDSHEHMLPLLFNLNGRPLTLTNHFQMRPLFSATLPPDMTYKTGRQISKCEKGSTLVFFTDGDQIPLETVVKCRIDKPVLTYDVDSDQFCESTILNYWETGVKDCLKLTTKSGKTAIATAEHKYLTHFGWTELQHLPVGLPISIVDKYPDPCRLWDEIVSIEKAGKHETYDLEVETYHNYVSNNIITHNSMSNAIHSVLFGFINPYHNVLHVAPLYVHMERFSNDYVAPLIAHSPLRAALITKQDKKAILQRSLKNGSNLIFTFAFHDCTRVRGISANILKYDEYQDLDPSFEPIINQTLAAGHMKSLAVNEDKASQPGIMRFGTPLTMENGLEQAWSRSSQAEWCIVCQKCKYDNVPSRDRDLDKMLGPKTRKIKVTRETPGLVCAKCGHYLYTREGRWVHQFPEREHTHAGYHIPQAIMTFHCEDNAAWTKMQQHRFNQNIMSVAKFYNEICGESYDHGQKLISVTDLRNAALLSPKTDKTTHLQWIRSGRYVDWGVGIDWGGGGQEGISKTAYALAGLRADGVVEVFTGFRSNTPNDFNLEASRTIDICKTFQVKFAAMDFNGSANAIRRSKVIDHGYPAKNIRPIMYTNVKDIARVVGAKETTPAHIQVNKARSFMLLSQLIRALRVRFFTFDFKSSEEPGLLNDFTALAEEKIEMKSVGDVHRVIHVSTAGPDDFAHAVNYAVCALFVRQGSFPDAGSILTLGDLTPDQQKNLEPALRDRDFSWFYED